MNINATIHQTINPATSLVGGPSAGACLIPGYTLLARIGSGGFGEVWKAEAPGGLLKAVKLVYGAVGESRATSEMKSLERVKQVRHPFLLTLERIELIDGRLVIVMELADSSLKDKLDDQKQAGQPGIPRKELLAHLHDAADALDYMYDEHALQHLDIKPENLLFVGNRIKVADFGLTKDLRETSISIMPGISPLYSGPEVFEGYPSRYSDQYSLAIVYQFLLTGQTPFQGRTLAQLMSQHLRSAPSLVALSPADRSTIGRALSKDPQRRFGSCRELIEQLMEHGTSHPAAVPRLELKTTQSPRPAFTAITERARDELQSGITRRFGPVQTDPVPVQIEQAPTPAPAAITDPKALIIGVGGLGGRVLGAVRERLTGRLGVDPQSPNTRFLYLDTDCAAVTTALNPREHGVLHEDEVLDLPIKSTRDYRGDAARFLEWIDRRWLYNVPRTLRTEGIRALGRLAVVDHARRLNQALRRAMAPLLGADSGSITLPTGETTSELIPPRVFIVASSTGGTGSGGILDVASAVRAAFAEIGCPVSNLTILLVHAMGRDNRDQDVAIANAVSLLGEIRWMHQVDCQNQLDVNSGAESIKPSPDIYFVDLGGDQDAAAYAQGVQSVAEFIYRNAATTVAPFLEEFRQFDARRRPTAFEELTVRTFGLALFEPAIDPEVCPFVVPLCRSAIRNWTVPLTNEPRAALRAEIDRQADSVMVEASLDLPQLRRRISELATGDFARELVAGLGQAVARLPWGTICDANEFFSRWDQAEHEYFQKCTAHPTDSAARFESDFSERVVNVRSTSAALCASLISRLDRPGPRLAAAELSVEVLVQKVDEFSAALAGLIQSTQADARALRNALSRETTPGGRRVLVVQNVVEEGFFVRYGTARFIEFSLARAACLLPEIRAAVERTGHSFKSLAASLDRIAGLLGNSPSAEADERKVDELFPDLEQELARQTVRNGPALASLLGQATSPDAERKFARRLRLAATAVLTGSASGNPPSGASPPVDDALQVRSVAAVVEAAQPKMSGVGGIQRRIDVRESPTGDSKIDLESAASSPVVCLADDGESGMVCIEVGEIPVGNVVRHLIGDRLDLLELASQLHTRVDVAWPGE